MGGGARFDVKLDVAGLTDVPHSDLFRRGWCVVPCCCAVPRPAAVLCCAVSACLQQVAVVMPPLAGGLELRGGVRWVCGRRGRRPWYCIVAFFPLACAVRSSTCLAGHSLVSKMAGCEQGRVRALLRQLPAVWSTPGLLAVQVSVQGRRREEQPGNHLCSPHDNHAAAATGGWGGAVALAPPPLLPLFCRCVHHPAAVS